MTSSNINDIFIKEEHDIASHPKVIQLLFPGKNTVKHESNVLQYVKREVDEVTDVNGYKSIEVDVQFEDPSSMCDEVQVKQETNDMGNVEPTTAVCNNVLNHVKLEQTDNVEAAGEHFIGECDYCNKMFDCRLSLVKHIHNHIIQESFKSLDNIGSTHVEGKSNNKSPYICNECMKNSREKDRQSQSKLKVNNEQSNVCNVCNIKKQVYKYCIVPMCNNTTRNAPSKLFFHIPRNVNVRNKWCQIMKRNSTISTKSSAYCCEDHFNVEEDTVNYMQYKIMSLQGGQRIMLQLKKGVVPHLFHCQTPGCIQPPKRISSVKRKRRALVDQELSRKDKGESPARRPRWIRERYDYFDMFDDHEFQIRYRLSKKATLFILSKIKHKLEFTSKRNQAISPMNQLLCALRFYATSSYLSTSANLGGFSKSTAHRIVNRVSDAIASLHEEFIIFPETREHREKIKNEFYKIAKFPNVIGAIDCTHVRIQSVSVDRADVFRNKKGYFSINVQAICDADSNFLDIIARCEGSIPDSHIFDSSLRKVMLESGRYENSYILGDSGYDCNKYLLTPLDKPQKAGEHLYNDSHKRSRRPIERAFRLWKKRFPCLAIGLKLRIENILNVIIATTVLHNMLNMLDERLPADDPSFILPAPWELLLRQGCIHEAGHRQNPDYEERAALIRNYFHSLL